MDQPVLERRSSFTTMTRTERQTYDTAGDYGEREKLLFVPRMGFFAASKAEERLSRSYTRPDAMVILVDGTETAQIPYELFKEIDPRLFVEVLRYAHTRHLLDKRGRLIEMTEHLLLGSVLP